ncbi:hypothetical protein L218DRAFT_1009792 [Marasmius fiardii PR-910]|nr:hypothetical protein L218DRAFT_1009792 [Marasmius fiardii PR-910]
MTEEEFAVRGLPRFIPELTVAASAWWQDDYEFVRELQEAKGFDPDTTDFAHAMGVPLLEIVSEDCFEDICDDNDSLATTDAACSMNVDSSPSGIDVDDCTPPREYQSSIGGLIGDVGLDIDMDDCSGDVGMDLDG